MYEIIELEHYGRKGMKWYQNIFSKHGSKKVTVAQQTERQKSIQAAKKVKVSKLTDKDLVDLTIRIELERQLAEVQNRSKKDAMEMLMKGADVAMKFTDVAQKGASVYNMVQGIKHGNRRAAIDFKISNLNLKKMEQEMAKAKADNNFNQWKQNNEKASYENNITYLKKKAEVDMLNLMFEGEKAAYNSQYGMDIYKSELKRKANADSRADVKANMDLATNLWKTKNDVANYESDLQAKREKAYWDLEKIKAEVTNKQMATAKGVVDNSGKKKDDD